jgi:hypothetical protein
MRVLSKVERLLQEYPQLRDSDRKLLVAFWHTQGLVLTPEQRQVFYDKCTPAEAITRARRKLKADYPESDAVREARYTKYQQYRGAHAVSWMEE